MLVLVFHQVIFHGCHTIANSALSFIDVLYNTFDLILCYRPVSIDKQCIDLGR
jgi:hypothetical protein